MNTEHIRVAARQLQEAEITIDEFLQLVRALMLDLVGEANCSSGTAEQNRYGNLIITELRQKVSEL